MHIAEQFDWPVAKIQLFSSDVEELAEIIARHAIIPAHSAVFQKNKCIFALIQGGAPGGFLEVLEVFLEVFLKVLLEVFLESS